MSQTLPEIGGPQEFTEAVRHSCLHLPLSLSRALQWQMYPLLGDGERSVSADGLYLNSWKYQQDGAAAHTSKETEIILNAVFKDRWIIDWQAKLSRPQQDREHMGLGRK